MTLEQAMSRESNAARDLADAESRLASCSDKFAATKGALRNEVATRKHLLRERKRELGNVLFQLIEKRG